MMTDNTLSCLIEQNWFARESYYLRKAQERLPEQGEAMKLVRQKRTQDADAAWNRSEMALWRHRAKVEKGPAFALAN
jgi:hypothetical protein